MTHAERFQERRVARELHTVAITLLVPQQKRLPFERFSQPLAHARGRRHGVRFGLLCEPGFGVRPAFFEAALREQQDPEIPAGIGEIRRERERLTIDGFRFIVTALELERRAEIVQRVAVIGLHGERAAERGFRFDGLRAAQQRHAEVVQPVDIVAVEFQRPAKRGSAFVEAAEAD